jgi:hypothetical protein
MAHRQFMIQMHVLDTFGRAAAGPKWSLDADPWRPLPTSPSEREGERGRARWLGCRVDGSDNKAPNITRECLPSPATRKKLAASEALTQTRFHRLASTSRLGKERRRPHSTHLGDPSFLPPPGNPQIHIHANVAHPPCLRLRNHCPPPTIADGRDDSSSRERRREEEMGTAVSCRATAQKMHPLGPWIPRS